MRRYQEEARRGVFLDELRSILESEVSWGVGAREEKHGGSAGAFNGGAEPEGPGTSSRRSLRIGVGGSLRRLRSRPNVGPTEERRAPLSTLERADVR